jgi:hypothetical protein
MNNHHFIILCIVCTFSVSACSEATGQSNGEAAPAEGSDAGAVNATDTSASSDAAMPEFMTSCSIDEDCDDAGVCSTGICKSDGTCEQIPRTGEVCDDEDACTEGETCQLDGTCGGGTVLDAIEDPCQTCTCSHDGGMVCEVKSLGGSCDDGDCCSVGDSCLACDVESDPDCASHGLKCVGNPKCADEDADPCT